MSLRAEISAVLAELDQHPRKRLGQHFMIDAGVLADLVATGAVQPGSRVLEIGPGTGVLTRRLLAAGAEVCAVELDQDLGPWLAASLADESKFTLVQGDALVSKSKLHPAIEAFAAADDWLLVANLPYDVSIPLVLNCLSLPRPPQQVSVTVQLEAAERLCAMPGTANWGASAAVAQSSGSGRVARKVPARSFWPQPRVVSAILAWTPERSVPEGFGRWCRDLFAYRRKRLTRALRDLGVDRAHAATACEQAGLDPERRVEELAVAELVALQAAASGRE